MRVNDLCHELRVKATKNDPPYDNTYAVIPLPPPAVSPSTLDVSIQCDEATKALEKIKVYSERLEDQWIISRILIREEAVSSSKIEGTNGTLDEILELEEIGSITEPNSQTEQIKDYALALDGFVPVAHEKGGEIFTEELIKSLHKNVMRRCPEYKDVPGNFRNSVVWIGGLTITQSVFNPPPPSYVGKCLGDTIAYMRGDLDQSHPPHIAVRMAVAHAHFEAVHPFRDGNGRVGRLLLPLIMAAAGEVPLYLSPYIEFKKQEYYSALKLAQRQLQWTDLIGFMATAISETTKKLLETQARLDDLQSRWRRRGKLRKNSASMKAIDFLPHYPIITTNRFAELAGVSHVQAHHAINQLLSLNIIKERTGLRRNRLFAATEALEIINRPFAED